jgi:hypothetical protein
MRFFPTKWAHFCVLVQHANDGIKITMGMTQRKQVWEHNETMQNNMRQSQWLLAVGLRNAHVTSPTPSLSYWESSWITKDFQYGSVEQRLPNFVNGICEKASVKCAILALRFQRAVSRALQSLLRRQADSSDLSVLRRRREGRKIARLTGRKKIFFPRLQKNAPT